MASSLSKNVIPASHLIPEHIIFDEMLTRLPVKSVCRFKCVSNRWRLVISDERFVKLHLLLYSPNFPRIMINILRPLYHLMHCSAHSLFSEKFVTQATQAIPIDFIKFGFKTIIGSCNGLLCMFVGHLGEFDLILWNPSTRKHMQLPSPDIGTEIVWADIGFSYDQSKDEYVLLLISYIGTGDFLSKLYRSRTNSWKIIENCDLGYPVYDQHFKFVAGKFHIPLCPKDSYNYEDDDFAVLFDIISFDLDTEEYGVIKHPEYGDNVVELSLEELGGNLCVLCNKETHVDLWVMKEYGEVESWTKTTTIRYNFFCSKLLTISQSREILLLHKVQGSIDNDRKFLVHDPNKNTQRVPEISNVGNFAEANVYVESLVCPNMTLVE